MGLDLDGMIADWDAEHPREQHVWEPRVDPHVLSDDDLDGVPEVMSSMRLTDEDIEINSLIERLDIVDAYSMWCARWKPRTRGRNEVKVRCPNPDHDDKDPSTYLNIAKQLGDCKSRCGGFDLYQMAAWHFGINDYKSKENFPQLKRMIAADLGYVMKKEHGVDRLVRVVTEDDAGRPDGDAGTATVTELHPVAEEPPAGLSASAGAPVIEWEGLAPEGTFLHQWMLATLGQDMPTEFYFWLGLMMIGLGCGRDAVLLDNPVVYGNLFVCLFGPSGIGKTKSSKAAIALLRAALPYSKDGKGVLIVPPAGSAEALIDSFVSKVRDEDTNEDTDATVPVRGLIHFDELSGLVSRASRVGNPMRPTLMEFYDGYDEVSTKSRSGGHVAAKDSFAAAVTSTQPGAIRDLISQNDADSGFLNRWVFAAGPPRPLIPYAPELVNIDPLVAPLRAIRSWAAQGRGLVLAGDALEAYTTFFYETIAPLKLSGDEALSTRLDLTLKKLMLLFSANDGLESPDVEIIERIITVSNYLRETYRFIQDEVNASDYLDIQEAILDVIKKRVATGKRAPTKSEIMRSLPRKLNRDVLRKVMSDLVFWNQVQVTEIKGANGVTMEVVDLAS